MTSPWVRRAILPALFALVMAAAIELAIELRYHPSFWQRSTYLMYDPYRGEPFDRAELAIRLGHLQDTEPDIISVGDSSGFFSLQSTIVNRYLGGAKYLSLNTGANHGYDGYYAIAEYMLQRSHHLKYVVLYVFPGLLPVDGVFKVADLADIAYRDLVSVKAYVTPPSAFLSPYAKFMIFQGRRFHASDPLGGSMPVLQLANTVDTALGWLPEFDVRYNRIDGRIVFDPDDRTDVLNEFLSGEPSSIVAYLNKFDRMVRSYGAHTVIAFAPVSERIIETGDDNIGRSDQALVRFQHEHPDVKFLFPLLTRWGSEKFGMFNHISREYTFLSSEHLGEGLARLLRDPEAIPPYVAQTTPPDTPYPPISIEPTGPEDPKLLDSSLALFSYATTTDKAYWPLLSRRVQQALTREPAFGYMMADAEARTASLAARGIKIGLDFSRLHATPVAVEGVPHCDPRPDLQWVQIDGSMIFTFDSPTDSDSEPVEWPKESGILFPTIIEDGVKKFDGYCLEPSLADQGR
jgi:hypothetical protein